MIYAIRLCFSVVMVCLAVVVAAPTVAAADREDVDRLAEVVRTAFREVHDGFSSDEVIVRDDLNAAFIKRCRDAVPDANEARCNWTLMSLRKAGRLDVPATRRVALRHDSYRHAAEIAARSMYDRHGLSVDRMMCNPSLRREFDAAARDIAPGVSAYRLRKAALALRKARQLRPELVVRVADWKKDVTAHVARDLSTLR